MSFMTAAARSIYTYSELVAHRVDIMEMGAQQFFARGKKR
jgi:hypothetical protein